MNETLKLIKFKNFYVEIVKGDITIEKTDAIVNAANEMLQHGGGLARLIAQKGGIIVERESNDFINSYGELEVGDVAVTTGGNLPAKHIIHAVGPVWFGGNKDEKKLLFNAITNSLKKAEDMNLTSIALPAVSCGIFRYPVELAVPVYKEACEEFDKTNPKSLKTIRFIVFDEGYDKVFLEVF
ncbi:hypothetical protein OSSY52_06790 [Tepiditoga spiralis]|uniref:Macro domain-containing protein n=1 Tax=Tepiditoga spiralis TaxID=2108365 RepID=A0A7G1G2L3_9BACT|nr:macro domain-containing protein [Tepiditoga spiralis]BBE30538.1 hypothetical protein OSSY52_06790 [Tepiditoga spiralis]